MIAISPKLNLKNTLTIMTFLTLAKNRFEDNIYYGVPQKIEKMGSTFSGFPMSTDHLTDLRPS